MQRGQTARHAINRWHWFVAPCLILVLGAAPLFIGVLPGCSCRDEAELSKNEKEKKKEKLEKLKKEKAKLPDFEPFRVRTLPADPSAEVRNQLVKPGHWTTAIADGLANNFDFPGELHADVVDRLQNPVMIDRTSFHVVTSRPAILAKGQKKLLDANFLLPKGGAKSWLRLGLFDRRGTDIKQVPELLSRMPSYEYYFLVLARQPQPYKFLRILDSVRPPSGDLQSGSPDLFYRVVLPRITDRVPLPAQPLCWTSMAYILWDGIEPTLLQPEQQQAMLDWLHWGGQLVISGPQTLDLLDHSFFDAYLPATAEPGTRELDAKSLAPLDESWTLEGTKSKPLSVDKPWIGITMNKHADAAYLPGTGELLAERRVGRGRIVVSAFRLSQSQLMNWPSFDSFFNACILRRAPRNFLPEQGMLAVEWAGRSASDRWNPRFVTSLRYFSRDAQGEKAEAEPAPDLANALPEDQQRTLQSWQFANPENATRQTEALKQSGAAGWNDFSAVSNAARHSLRDAAGIVIPKREFVLRILGVYLLILVPVNWTLFRFLGRIEYAWIAAPLIAIVGAVAVIRLAQLDIGFARSQTEIATLELQAGYPRAHLTRYTALYSSLSSSYDVNFDDPSAVALPLSNDFAMIAGQRVSNVNFRRDKQIRLSDIEVRSNSTVMLHSEQMYELGGTIELKRNDAGDWIVHNQTPLTLVGVGVIHHSRDSGSKEAAWIGTLAPDQEARLKLESADTEQWNVKRAALRGDPASQQYLIDMDRLLTLAQNSNEPEAPDIRLVGWTEGELQGIHVEPAAAQIHQATMVVANLHFAQAAPPRPDQKLRSDVRDVLADDRRSIDDEPDALENQDADSEAGTPQ